MDINQVEQDMAKVFGFEDIRPKIQYSLELQQTQFESVSHDRFPAELYQMGLQILQNNRNILPSHQVKTSKITFQ